MRRYKNLYLCPLLKGDGGSGGKSKVRAKKPTSKYNEEISSDSETERLISDGLTWGYALMAASWYRFQKKNITNRFLLHSPVVTKKRQSNEENDYAETPQEKKLRLAKLYLDQLKEEGKHLSSTRHRDLTLQCMRVCIYCVI